MKALKSTKCAYVEPATRAGPVVVASSAAPMAVRPIKQQPVARECEAPAQRSLHHDPEVFWVPVSPEVQEACDPEATKGFYRSVTARDNPLNPLDQLFLQPFFLSHHAENGFSVQLNDPPQQHGSDDRQKRADYYANVGDAIRTLRDDVPLLFAKELNYDIYREDIVFKQSSLRFTGIDNYKLIFWSLRFHGRLFFTRLSVSVLRIWQPEDSQIKMRWRVHAKPRVWWEAEGTFDGISTYKLDREGKIYEHSVDNVQLRDPPITNPVLYALNYIFRPRMQPSQMPVPGSYFSDEHVVTNPVACNSDAPAAEAHPAAV